MNDSKLRRVCQDLRDMINGLPWCSVTYNYYTRSGSIIEHIRISFDESYQIDFLLPSLVQYFARYGDYRIEREEWFLIIEEAE